MNEDLVTRIKEIFSSVSKDEQQILKQILVELAETGESRTYNDIWLADYKEIPVSKRRFLTDPQYLGASNNNGQSIYPAWMEVMDELERTGNQYYEIVFTGATRTGKTSTAVSDCAYNLYKLMCLRNPQEYFSLKAVTTIQIFFFNITQTLAKGVAYREFNSTLATSEWFMSHGHMSKSEEYPAYVPEGGLIKISYGSEASHALGMACFAVVFDECNFAIAGIKDVNKAKERMKAKYDTLVARVTGTFVKNGEVFGKLYVISSKNSDSDFMEEYVQTQKAVGNEHMYVFDKPQWEVWPASKYSSDKKFKVALGGKHTRSFVIPDNDDNEQAIADLRAQGYGILEVPEDNKKRFLADIDIALRDIAGVTVPGQLSFITQDQIDRCIGDRRNPFYSDIITVGTNDNLTIEEFFHLNEIDPRLKSAPNFIHLDLSLNTDRTGISMVCVSGVKDITDADGKVTALPNLIHIFSVALQAPRGSNIAYDKVMSFIVWLRRQGFNIAGISRDQFQSEYLGQLLASKGFKESKISLDRTPDGYLALRSVLTEQRIDLLHVELLENELIHLQRDAMTGRVDHVTSSSKDCSDSLAGAVWNAVQQNPGVAVQAKTVASIIAAVNKSKTSAPTPFSPFIYTKVK